MSARSGPQRTSAGKTTELSSFDPPIMPYSTPSQSTKLLLARVRSYPFRFRTARSRHHAHTLPPLNAQISISSGVIPFSRFFASNRPFNAPFAGLALHWTVSVIIMLAPPEGDAYNLYVCVRSRPRGSRISCGGNLTPFVAVFGLVRRTQLSQPRQLPVERNQQYVPPSPSPFPSPFPRLFPPSL